MKQNLVKFNNFVREKQGKVDRKKRKTLQKFKTEFQRWTAG